MRPFGRNMNLLIRKIFLYISVTVIAVYSFLPIYWMFISAVRGPHELFS